MTGFYRFLAVLLTAILLAAGAAYACDVITFGA